MQTIRLVDALAVRIVTAADCRSMDAVLEDVGKQISQIEAHLAPNNVQGLKHQVETLRSQLQVTPRSPFSIPFPARLSSRVCGDVAHNCMSWACAVYF